jgi:hypothetical protein
MSQSFVLPDNIIPNLNKSARLPDDIRGDGTNDTFIMRSNRDEPFVESSHGEFVLAEKSSYCCSMVIQKESKRLQEMFDLSDPVKLANYHCVIPAKAGMTSR